MKKTKPKIYFVPVYIASMKYYAKLFSYLSDIYDVRFLIVRGKNKRRNQMEKFCKENDYYYDLIEDGLNKLNIRIPFFTAFSGKRKYTMAIISFLKKNQPAKIILTKALPPFNIIISEANKLNIETIVLQTAFIPSKGFFPDRITRTPFIKRVYYRSIDFIYNTLSHLRSNADSLDKPKKVGVIDEDAAKSFNIRFGFSLDTIQTVGMADFQIVHNIKEQITSDKIFRSKLENKYNLNQHKLNIMIIAQSHHLKSGTNVTTEGQIERYRNIVQTIRKIFTKDEADVLLKLHPSDKLEIYKSYEELGVKIFADESDTDELLCISDLCIADAWTSTNYMILASNIPAIFINLFSSYTLDGVAKKYYKVKDVVVNEGMFLDKLNQFKNNELKNQYDNSHIDVKSIDKITKFIKND